MAKTVIITCRQEVTYRQSVTVTDEEYELIKGLNLDDIGPGDEDVYQVIDKYIEKEDEFERSEEFVSVQVKLYVESK